MAILGSADSMKLDGLVHFAILAEMSLQASPRAPLVTAAAVVDSMTRGVDLGVEAAPSTPFLPRL